MPQQPAEERGVGLVFALRSSIMYRVLQLWEQMYLFDCQVFAVQLKVTLLFLSAGTKRRMNRASLSGRTGKYYYQRVGGRWEITAATDPAASL